MPTDPQPVRVATRKSPLALRQTELAVAALQAAYPGRRFEILPMSTTGDERLSWSLEASGGKGLFTSALEQAIVRGEADLAVHSSKDLPTEMPEGVALAGFLPRAWPGDALFIRSHLSEPGMIATGSPRRRAQLKRVFPHAAWKEIRGNVQTRLQKVADGFADATVMAMAGLHRLGIGEWPGLRMVPLPLKVSVPAPGQGAIGMQVRTADREAFARVFCPRTALAVEWERSFLSAMGGGCHSATAALYLNGSLHTFHDGPGYRCLEIPDSLRAAGSAKRLSWIQEQLS